MTARPIVAVIPFGARGTERRGAVARQLARRLVERLAREAGLELRPVFLVALPETDAEAGYLVFGSTPGVELAAQYASSLGCTHALAGTYQEDGEAALDLVLVDAVAKRAVREHRLSVPVGDLPRIEPELARWLARALAVELADAGAAVTGSADAYRALLEGMDEEVNATLLERTDAARAEAAARAALGHHLDALRADAECEAAEERLLVMAAQSLEGGAPADHVGALEELTQLRPRSWRGHYLLGELRRARGDVAGAIVAFEHAHAVRPLREADLLQLAELYVAAGTPGPAVAHLRRIAAASDLYGRAQELEGALALGRGDVAGAVAALRRAIAAGAPARARVDLARALIADGKAQDAAAELEAVLRTPGTAEAAAARRLLLGIRHPDLERELEDAGRLAMASDAAALEAAAASFRRVLAAEPDLWEAEFGLGLIARRRGDAGGAERAFRRVLDLHPGQPDAVHELGVALLMSDKAAEAARLLDEAAALRPDDAGYLADAGFAQLRSGDLAGGRQRLELATQRDREDPVTRAYVAELERVEAEAARG